MVLPGDIPTRWHWRCSCGGHSHSDGFMSENDAEWRGRDHVHRQPVSHFDRELGQFVYLETHDVEVYEKERD
jgi:hypothetical protein